MQNHTLMKVLFVLVACCAVPFAWAVPAPVAQEQETLLAKELQKAALQQQWTQTLHLLTLQSTWERCDVLVSRARANGKPRVRVVKPWTCRPVNTSCSAVAVGDKIFAPAACFYAAKKDDQSLSLKDSKVLSEDGVWHSLAQNFIGKAKDFVVFQK